MEFIQPGVIWVDLGLLLGEKVMKYHGFYKTHPEPLNLIL